MSRAKDISGKRFGKLVAIRQTGEKKRGSTIWECKCDCGNMVRLSIKDLWERKSCGCLSHTDHTSKNISGMRFERLTAIKPTEGRTLQGHIIWECKCDCGNIVRVASVNLLRGHTKSCGCYKTERVRRNASDARNNLQYIDGTCVNKIKSKKIYKNNTSGCRGVSPYFGKWKAQIQFKGIAYQLGIYENIKDAIEIRKNAEGRLFDEFIEWYENEYKTKFKNQDTGS